MIIAFTGKMGSGKSTAIEELNEIQGKTVRLLKFAAPLYDMQEYIYRRISYIHQRPESFIKDRRLLQYLGTEWARNTVGENLLVDLWKNEIKRCLIDSKHVLPVCDDLRFNNEAQAVKELGGIIVNIKSEHRGDRIELVSTNHASENGIDEKYIDHTINNDGTIKDLRDRLKEVLNHTGVPVVTYKE